MMEANEGSNRKALIVTAVVVLAAVVGLLWLSLSGGPAEVSGVVTLDDQPVAGAQVVFVGVEEGKETPIVASTDSDGAYKLLPPSRAGVPVGKYKVTVARMVLKDGSVPSGERREQARSQGLLINMLPKDYEDRATTPFAFDVKSGANTINLSLKKKL